MNTELSVITLCFKYIIFSLTYILNIVETKSYNLFIFFLIARTYTALETLTEPHQVVSTLSCATTVSRTLLSSCQYPEGRGHMFMLLKLALPGIDPNDFRKMLVWMDRWIVWMNELVDGWMDRRIVWMNELVD